MSQYTLPFVSRQRSACPFALRLRPANGVTARRRASPIEGLAGVGHVMADAP